MNREELNKENIDSFLRENNYKSLGWQNSWKFPYSKEEQSEYSVCREAEHDIYDIRHNDRGSEHTVSCDICKIYWKYDSSD